MSFLRNNYHKSVKCFNDVLHVVDDYSLVLMGCLN